MRKIFYMLAMLTLSNQCGATVTSFDDIDYWVGTGANRAALVLDWQGDSTLDNSLAWGYRWDGAPKTIDMFTAIVAADPRLFAKIGPVGGFGTGVFGVGCDNNSDGEFAIDDDTSFDEQGFANSAPADGAESVDPNDWYEEGWFVSGYWHYGVATGNPYDGGTWARSGSGISNRNLVNDTWHSLAFTPTFSNQAFARNAIAAPATGNADFDGDGDVDGRDFIAWQRGFGTTTGALFEQGDANSDGAVDAADLALWTEQYGTFSNTYSAFTGGALQGAALVVPEPTSLSCLCLAVGAWSAFFRLFRLSTRKLNS